jgi:hypothetical protein
MSVDIAQLKEQEQIDVLERALELIIKPDTWVKGQWKCPVYEDKSKTTIFNPYANAKQATDEKGNPLYAYCLEGAINQAVVDLYGIPRAEALGAWSEEAAENNDSDDLGIAVEEGRTPTDIISLNELVMQKYSDNPAIVGKHRSGDSQFAAMLWQDHPETTHAQVVGLVKRKLAQLRRRASRA